MAEMILRFNPTLVRLRYEPQPPPLDAIPCFNPTLVRLRWGFLSING